MESKPKLPDKLHDKAMCWIFSTKAGAFFRASLASTPCVVADIATAATNGRRIQLGRFYWELDAVPKRVYVLAHEAMHKLLQDLWRGSALNHSKFNRACDIRINEWLDQMNLGATSRTIGCGLFNKDTYHELANIDISKMTPEEIYRLIPDEPGDKDGKGSKDDRLAGDMQDPATECTPEDSKKAQAEAADIARRASNAKGDLPVGLRDWLGDLINPCLKWEELLREFLEPKGEPDCDWRRPNKRLFACGIPSPRWYNTDAVPKVGVIIDTSGSVGHEELCKALGAIHALAYQAGAGMAAVSCSTYAVPLWNTRPGDKLPPLPQLASGGSNMCPAFELLDAMAAEDNETLCCIVYIGDGCAEFPDDGEVQVPFIGLLDGYVNEQGPSYAAYWKKY